MTGLFTRVEIAGIAVDLMEVGFLGLAGGRIERDRAGHERGLEIALPVSAAGGRQLPVVSSYGWAFTASSEIACIQAQSRIVDPRSEPCLP